MARLSAHHVLPQVLAAQVLPAHSPQRVDEEMFARIGGIDQWITIKGDDRIIRSCSSFFGLTLSGALEDIDLPALGTNFEISNFILQGQKDLTALPEMAKAYFDSSKAPRKQFYLVPGTATNRRERSWI